MGFVATFVTIYIFNWTIFIAIMVSLMKHHHAAETKRESIRKQLRTAIGISLLFGLGWGFGFGATQGLDQKALRLIFALAFTTLTGFQGLFIFIFYCILSEKVRNVWKSWVHCAGEQKRSTLESASRVHKKVIASTVSSGSPLLQADDDPQYKFNDFVHELTTYELDKDSPVMDSGEERSGQLQDLQESHSSSSGRSSSHLSAFERSESTEYISMESKLKEGIVSLNELGSLGKNGDREKELSSPFGQSVSNVSLSSFDSMELSVQGSLASDSVLMLEL